METHTWAFGHDSTALKASHRNSGRCLLHPHYVFYIQLVSRCQHGKLAQADHFAGLNSVHRFDNGELSIFQCVAQDGAIRQHVFGALVYVLQNRIANQVGRFGIGFCRAAAGAILSPSPGDWDWASCPPSRQLSPPRTSHVPVRLVPAVETIHGMFNAAAPHGIRDLARVANDKQVPQIFVEQHFR